jgi:hypothetical protein
MRDESSQECENIRVRVDGAAAPYLLIATSQVPQVQVLFDGVGLKYAVTEKMTAADDCPLSTVTFEDGSTAEEIQQLLDELD